MAHRSEDVLKAKRELAEVIIDEGLWDYPEELEKRLCDVFPDERVEVIKDGDRFVAEIGGLRLEIPPGRMS